MNNTAGEMEVFAQVAALRSFSAAGRRLRLSPSAVSKLIGRIEDRLGTRLFLRSTHALQLTPEGELYLGRVLRILAEIEDAERLVAHGAQAAPRGLLRVSASVGFGITFLEPVIPNFLRRYPQVELSLSLTDSVIDLVGERADIAVRSGPLPSSTLKARKILSSRRVVVASPAYLARCGTPEMPDALAGHACLGFNFPRSFSGWPFRDPATGARMLQSVSGPLQANNGPTLRRLAIDGLGLARLGEFHVRRDIAAGRLVPVLEAFNAEDIELIHAVYLDHEHLAARVRSFIDYLVESMPRG